MIVKETYDKMNPELTVIIPVYNMERFLSKCLESVMQQTLSNLEIICVDDGSTDHSGLILEKYAEKDSRIRIIWHKKNAGLVKTRKDAVLSAKGKYLLFLDSDDELFPDSCEVAFKAIEKNKTDAVQFGLQNIDFQSKFITTGAHRVNEKVDRIEDENWLYLFDKGKIKVWSIANKIYNTALCKKAYGQMEDGHIVMAEDTYLFFVYGYYAKSISMIDNVLYKYRQGAGVWSGISETFSLEKYKVLLSEKKALDAILRFYKTKPNADKYELIVRKRVKDVFLQHSISWWQNNLMDKDKVAGLQIINEIWGRDDFASALGCRLEKMNSDNMNLQNELAKEREKNSQLKKNNEEMKKQVETALRELNNVKTGWSFRTGRIITSVPRKIRDWLK